MIELLRRSLFAKLALVLVVALAALGVTLTVTSWHVTQRYVDEVEQRLNLELAGHLAHDTAVLRDGEIDAEALEHVFHQAMVLHPRIECYLLDPDGNILAFDLPAEAVRAERVELEPLSAVLTGERLPIYGENPRHPDRRSIFSVAPVVDAEGAASGFLYVVLAGEPYTTLADRLSASYALRLGLLLAGLALALGVVAALVATRGLLARLRRLDRRAASIAPGGGEGTAGLVLGAPRSGDEVDRLAASFDRMERRIAEQMEALREGDAQRREMVANVSHDLRTPLASLRGYLETLLLKERSLDPERRREYLETALAQSERLARLVDDLFELSRLDAGSAALEPEPFSLSELAQDIAQKFRLRAEGNGAELVTAIEQDTPLVEGDLRLVERVLENLLDNALRHTPAGRQVELGVAAVNGSARVWVRDQGAGIPEQELPKVFDRFYRGSWARGERGPRDPGAGDRGSGLGLAIAKRVVELHGSHLEVESVEGVGSRFAFEL